jgi:hypothetical protein
MSITSTLPIVQSPSTVISSFETPPPTAQPRPRQTAVDWKLGYTKQWKVSGMVGYDLLEILHGSKNNKISKVIVLSRHFTSAGVPAEEAVSFYGAELAFVADSLELALQQPRPYQAERKYGNRNALVRKHCLRDDYLTLDSGTDETQHLSVYVVGFRIKDRERVRVLNEQAAYQMCQQVKMAKFLCDASLDSIDERKAAFRKFWGMSLLRAIEPAESQWTEMVDTMLTFPDQVDIRVSRLFASPAFNTVCEEGDRITRALHLDAHVMTDGLCSAASILREFLPTGMMFTNRFLIELFA